MNRRRSDQFWTLQAQPWAVVSLAVTLIFALVTGYVNRAEQELSQARVRELQDLRERMFRVEHAGCEHGG